MLLHDLEHEKGERVGDGLLHQPRRQPLRPPTLPHHLLEFEEDEVLAEVVPLLEALRLQPGADDLEGVREGSGDHAGDDAREQFVLACGLELLVEHVVEAAEGALLDAARQSAAEEAVHALLPVDVQHRRVHRSVPVEVGQLESRLNHVQRVGQQRARQPGQRGHEEVLHRSHVRRLEGPQPREVDVAAEGGLERGGHHALVEAAHAVGAVDVLAGGLGVREDAAAQVDRLQLAGRQHQRHLDVLEGLQQRSRDHPAHHPEQALVIDHQQRQKITCLNNHSPQYPLPSSLPSPSKFPEAWSRGGKGRISGYFRICINKGSVLDGGGDRHPLELCNEGVDFIVISTYLPQTGLRAGRSGVEDKVGRGEALSLEVDRSQRGGSHQGVGSPDGCQHRRKVRVCLDLAQSVLGVPGSQTLDEGLQGGRGLDSVFYCAGSNCPFHEADHVVSSAVLYGRIVALHINDSLKLVNAPLLIDRIQVEVEVSAAVTEGTYKGSDEGGSGVEGVGLVDRKKTGIDVCLQILFSVVGEVDEEISVGDSAALPRRGRDRAYGGVGWLDGRVAKDDCAEEQDQSLPHFYYNAQVISSHQSAKNQCNRRTKYVISNQKRGKLESLPQCRSGHLFLSCLSRHKATQQKQPFG